MKKWLVALGLMAVAGGVCPAQERGFGAGAFLGEPTGICIKSWTGSRTAVAAAAAWSFGHHEALHVHFDYLFHDFRLIKTEHDPLPFYYGVGVRFKDDHELRMGIRIPIGIDYMFKKAPVDIFLEFVPVFDLIPSTELFFNGGIGVRYFF
jgi:hypothetical protein